MHFELEDLKKLFGHDAGTPEQKQKHARINEAAARFAQALCEEVDNPAEITGILRAIQDIRTKSNIAVRFEVLNISYRDTITKTNATQ